LSQILDLVKNPTETTQKIVSGLRDENLVYKVLPQFLAEIIIRYFDVEIEGLENIPKRGPVLVCPNHSGVTGFDALILAYVIQKHTGRIPRVLTHRFWFLTQTTAIPANKLGFIEASYKNGVDCLKKNNVVIIFPEGEHGNFKATRQMYELQEFRRGFVRMALETSSPIVPTLILGAEEANINLSKLQLTRFLRGLVIPLPLNIIPLPTKWKIKFLPPRELLYPQSMVNDSDLVRELAEDIQEDMQEQLKSEVKKRDQFFSVLKNKNP
jgi:1-acyl-sn-glycerol-3-phosphate acyltransferase